MKLKIQILLFIIVLILTNKGDLKAQQDVQFSQYIFNSLNINPAYAGYKEDLYFNGVIRKQYVNFQGAPETGAVSLDGLVNSDTKSIGLGGQITWDRLGPQTTTSVFGSYSYRMRLDEDDSKRLCIGFSFGFNQYSVDGSALQYVDANDPSIPVGTLSTIKPDARLGIYYFTPTFFASFSMMDLLSLYNNGNIYLSNGTMVASEAAAAHINLSLGGLVKMSDNVKLKPSFLIKEDFHGPTSLDLNLFALLSEKLWVGTSYRTAIKLWQKPSLQTNLQKSGALSIMAELFATDNLRIGYSYDIITSNLAGYQSGSHEISVGLLFPNNKVAGRIKSPRYF